MVFPPVPAQRVQLALEVRKRFVGECGRALIELGNLIQERLTTLMSEAAPARELQLRRDVWMLYQRMRPAWSEGTLKAWQAALMPLAMPNAAVPPDGSFELLGTEVVENKITSSRLALALIDKVSVEMNDLHLRVRHLEGNQDTARHDILRPEVLTLAMIEQWSSLGMPPEAWALVNDAVRKLLTERLKQAYTQGNEFLIKQGVLPTIELKDRVRFVPSVESRNPSSRSVPLQPSAENSTGSPANFDAKDSGAPSPPLEAAVRPRSGGMFGGRLGWGNSAGGPASQPADHPAGAVDTGRRTGSAPGHDSAGYGGTADETRMMTSGTPLARARSRAMGVVGQLKRLLVGSAGANDDTGAQHLPSPALAAALSAAQARPAGYGAGGDTVLEDYSPAGVLRVAGELRHKTSELKAKAETKGEKATIEIVALMFQAILQEERIPPGIRVWFARLQMPVLRVALAEPDFFGTLNHPARQLIDRMGSCVMGFDASGIQTMALQTEIKRVVQVIEQYPETGKRVFQLVYEEFQKFLAQFLTGKASTQKVVSVAQQVEQKETLTIQYTIEMRNMLRDMPVRDEIREFLFKVWAEVLAVAAVRKGPQHAETLGLKKSASELVWAASAKPNRADRARVIQDLPQLLQRLRAGMSLLGVPPSEQEQHIKTVSDTLADAFLSKTQAIPAAQIQAMAARLENLEDFLSDDSMGDLPLDAESIELMLGIDASMIDVVADGGSRPNEAMLAWAQELQLGSWFTLDHNGRVSQVQFVWRSERKHLHLFASTDGRSCLIQAGRLAAYLQAGLLLPQEEEALTVRATRDALGKLEANPERLLG
jgi:hypothetical protein